VGQKSSDTFRTCYVGTPQTDLSESRPKLSLEGTKYIQNQLIGGLYRYSAAMPSTSPLKLLNPADKLIEDPVNLRVNAKFKATGIVHSLLSSSKAGPRCPNKFLAITMMSQVYLSMRVLPALNALPFIIIKSMW
jgi:hypothetical protein